MKKLFYLILFYYTFISSAIAQTQPGSGKSLQFNGSSYINCSADNRGITNKVTVEAWIKTSNTNLQMICTKYNNPADRGFQLFTQNGFASFNGRDGSALYETSGFSTTMVADGKWHHIVGTYSYPLWEIWVDGIFENSAAYYNSSSGISNTAPFSIGNYQLVNSNFFIGEIDEVRLWNTVRTGLEIRDNMCRKLNLNTSGLVGYYKLDEGTGNTTTDHSTFNIPGSLTNFSSTAWRTSGAPIGDVSIHETKPLFPANFKISLPGLNNDTFSVQNIIAPAGGNVHSIHIYRINSLPNSTSGIPFTSNASYYFGVFTKGKNFTQGQSIGYSILYTPENINCSTNTAILSRREDNAITSWQQYPMSRYNNNSFYAQAAEHYRGEYYIVDRANFLINGNLSNCTGTPTVLTAPTSSSYLWNTGQTTQAISASTSGKYYVTATNSLGCVFSDTVQVTITPPFNANAGNDVAFCTGESATLGTAAIAGYTYSWSPAVGLSSTTVANPTVSFPNSTTSQISQTYTLTVSQNGCSATNQVSVTVKPKPLLPTGLSRQICSGEPTNINATPIAGYSYSWSPATGLSDPNVLNPTITLTNPSTSAALLHNYTLTITNIYGCITTVPVLINVKPAIVANAGNDVSVCNGQSVTIGSASIAGYTYSWSPQTGLSNPYIANPTVELPNSTRVPIQQTYTVTTTFNDCSVTDQVTVTINPLPDQFSSSSVFTCSNEPITIGFQPVTDNTYLWSPATGLSSPTVANPTFILQNNNTSTYWIQLYVLKTTNASGCSSFNYVYVHVKPIPIADAGADKTICSGATVTIGSNAVTDHTFSWSPATGLSNPNVANPTVTLINNTSTPITQTYTLTTTKFGCDTTDQVTVTINPLPVADAGPDKTICSTQSTGIGTNPIAGNTYSWSPATGLSDPNIANPTVTLPNSTSTPIQQTYTVTTTFNGCTSTDQVTVTVNPSPAIPNLDYSVCSGEPTIIGVGPQAGTTYSWSPTAGLSNPNIANPKVTLTNTSTTVTYSQTYTLTATNAFGCVTTGTLTVYVKPTIAANAGPDVSFCNKEWAFIGTGNIPGATYSWSPTLGLNANVGVTTVTFTNNTGFPISRTYKLTTTYHSCTYVDSVIVTIYPQPIADAGADKTICSTQSIGLGVSTVTGNTYSWSPATGLSNTAISDPVTTLINNSTIPITQTYILTVTNSLGCIKTDTVNVIVNPLPVSNAGSDATICSGSSTTLGTSATTGYTYSWLPATGLSSTTSSNPTISLINNTAAPITQTYTLTSTYYSCTTTDQVTVTVQPKVFVNAGPDKTVCGDKSVSIGTTALPNYTYNWAAATGLSSTTSATPVYTGINNTGNPIPIKLYLTATSTLTNCSALDSVIVTINPKPVIDSIIGSFSVCPGVLGVDYHIKNPRLTAYQWIVEGGTIASGQGTTAITVNWGVSGPGKVKTYTLNTFGCSSDTILFPVVINPLLITQKPAGPRQLCFYEAKNIYYQPPVATNGSFYTYQVFGGSITSPNPSTSGITVNWHAPGKGKIVVTETSTTNLAHCFGVSDTLLVTINPSPDTTLAINGKASACAYSQNHTYTLGGSSGSTYLWQLNGTTLPGNSNIINVNLQAAGNYTLTVLETNSFGCPSRKISKIITATPLPGTLSINGPTMICPDNQNNLQYSVTGLPGSTYNWKVTGGTITSGNGSNTIFVDFDNSRDKTIEVVETSSGNCVGSRFDLPAKFDNSELQLALVSTAEADFRDVEISLNMLNATVNTQPIDIYRRETGAGNTFKKIASIPNSQQKYTDPGLLTDQKIYEYSLESMNECGTQVRKTVQHNVVKLTAVAEENSKTAFLSWNTYKGWGINGVSKYEIYGKADNGNYAIIQEIKGYDSVATLARIAEKGFAQCFRIKAISTSGLISWSNEICVNFENKVVIYNIITANNDRLNDYFTVENIHLYPGNELTLFNRWGVEIFRQKDYLNHWDGRNFSDGTYYYLLKLKDGRSFKGWFDIVRD